MGVRFLPVKWGKRYYLVDENEMPGFCVAAADKEDIRTASRQGIHGLDYVKWDGKELPPLQGKPLLPERYKSYYEHGAVQAKVVRLLSGSAVVLNKGGAERVKEGMLLTINAYHSIEAKVVSTTEHESVAQPLYFRNSDQSVKIGDSFTTGGYWTRPHGTGFETFVKPPDTPRKR